MAIACECDGLPPHDHFMGHRLDDRGVYRPFYDHEDCGHVWVDWKAVAHALATTGTSRGPSEAPR